MNPVLLEILPQIRAGMCCSQLLAALALQVRGEENTDWLRAARGLCHGVGQSGGPCGLLGGGAMILAYLSGQDNEPHPMLEAMCNDYAEWFYGACADFGGYGCEQISAGLMRQAACSSTPQLSTLPEFWLSMPLPEGFGRVMMRFLPSI